MINLIRPRRCLPSDHGDRSAHWVEPRTLRSFRYSTLRRDHDQKPVNRQRTQPFFAPKQEGVICAGHYVYGERHYAVALDIKHALDGEIGGEIGSWITDICMGERTSGVLVFTPGDFKDVAGLCSKLLNHKDPVSQLVWEKLSPATKVKLKDADIHEEQLQRILAEEFNLIRAGGNIYEPARFPGSGLSSTTSELLREPSGAIAATRINRLLLEDAYSREIVRCPRASMDWESERGRSLGGEVSVVLMPLHSQMHYLWPRIESLLAQRGRRIHMWLLDATLFLGHGPAYHLPLQFEMQIESTIKEQVEARKSGVTTERTGLRILILDDAMVSARTAETVIARIDRAVAKAFEGLGIMVESVRPVEWIRYFAVFNLMSHAKGHHWRNLSQVGSLQKIPFVFEYYRPVMGVPVFEEANCPACAEVDRLDRLHTVAGQHMAESVREWAEERQKAIRAVAIDSPGFRMQAPVPLPRTIDLLGRATPPREPDIYQPQDADEAILRFYELVYLSYPPTDILPALAAPNAWSLPGEPKEIIVEYERFRLSVFEWCLHNWPRLIADSARPSFFAAVERELNAQTHLVQTIFEGLANLRNDEFVKSFAVSSLDSLATMEKGQGQSGIQDERVLHNRKKVLLADSLTIFLLSIPRDDLKTFEVTVKNEKVRLVDYLANLARSLSSPGLTFIGQMNLCFSRPRQADPAWALQTVAESLFRNRDPDARQGEGNHLLLPRLLSDVNLGKSTNVTFRLLQSSLSLFLAAFDDLSLFAAEEAIPFGKIKSLGDRVLNWLKKDLRDTAPPNCVRDLLDALSLEEQFCKAFSGIFHESVESLRGELEKRAEEVNGEQKGKNGNLDFKYCPDDEVKRFRMLIPHQRVSSFVSNWAIDRTQQSLGSFKSRVEVHRKPMLVGTDQIQFRILTSFAPPSTTQGWTVHGPNYDVETRMLKLFGATLDNQWQSPSELEKEEGFTASFEFKIPTGFTPHKNI